MWGSTKRCHSLFLEVPLDWRSGFESISILLCSIFLNESTWSRSSWKCFLQITTSKLSILATEVSYIWRLFFARLDVEIDRLPWSLGPWLIKLTQPMPSTQADQGDCSVVSMSTPGPGVSEVLVYLLVGWVVKSSTGLQELWQEVSEPNVLQLEKRLKCHWMILNVVKGPRRKSKWSYILCMK